MNPLAFYNRLLNDVPLVTDAQMTTWFTGLTNHAAQVEAFAKLLSAPANAEPEYYGRIRKYLEPKMTVDNKGIATIPIDGPLAYAPDPFEMLYYGVEDSRSIHTLVKQAANDPEVKGVLLKINSPGGMVTGGVEIADDVKAMVAKGKPVVSHTAGTMASLAYQIGSQANAVVATRTGTVGSIGTMISFLDMSRMYEAAGAKVHLFKSAGADLKGIGTPGLPLTEPQAAYLQSRVDAAAKDFRDMVSAKRPKVTADSMRGQAFWGSEALERGLIDAVGSEESAMGLLRRMVG